MTDDTLSPTGPAHSHAAPTGPPFRRAGRGRVGYRLSEVDKYAARVAEAFQHEPPRLTAAQVAGQRFHTVRLRVGYDMREVDAWLDRTRDELRHRGGSAAVPEPAPSHHVRTWWIYLVALVLVAAMAVFVATQL